MRTGNGSLRVLSVAIVSVGVLVTEGALAQDEGGDVPVDVGADVPTEGEEVFVEAFAEANAEPPELPETEETEQELEEDPHPDDLLWTLAGGGTLSYGNARTAGLNISTSLGIRRGPDIGVVEGSFLYAIAQSPLSCGAVQANPVEFPTGTVDYCGPSGTGMAARARAPGFNDWAETAANLGWRIRYDHFFDEANAFFLAHRGRLDRFAGVVPRLSVNLGYERLLFEERNHLLGLDLGIDGTFDLYSDPIRAQTQAIVARGGTLAPLSGTDARFVPSVRLMITYVNRLLGYFTYDTTFEALWDVVTPAHFRFEWVNHLRTTLDRIFQIRLDVTFRLDGLPPGQAQVWNEDPSVQTTTMFEVLTTLNLVGNFDLDGAPPHRRVVEPEHAPQTPVPSTTGSPPAPS